MKDRVIVWDNTKEKRRVNDRQERAGVEVQISWEPKGWTWELREPKKQRKSWAVGVTLPCVLSTMLRTPV